MRKELNIYTIAKEAGVSPATVSRVITQNARVSEEKRQRVEQVIKKYDYRPNALAQGLINTQTKIIGLLVADLINPFYSLLITSCESEINKQGYIPMICSSTSDQELEVKYLQKMCDMRVDAIVMIGGKSDDLITDPEYADLINRIAISVPVVTTGKVEGAQCSQVSIDQVGGIDQAMEYLISQGHHRIALIGGKNNIKSTYDKRMRYRSVLRKHGIAYRERYIIESDYSIEGGYLGVNAFFESNKTMPTAIMTINDYSAVGAIRCIKERGMRIPEDIALLSFDNTYIVDTVIPKLTSISYDYEVFGKMLIDTAIKMIQKEEVPEIQKVVTSLVVRESTARA